MIGSNSISYFLDSGGSLVDDSVETVMVVGGVVDCAHGTVRFDQRILSLHNISITLLNLRFDISGVWILNTIVERILWVGNWLMDVSLVDGGMHNWGGMYQGWAIVSVFNGGSCGSHGDQ